MWSLKGDFGQKKVIYNGIIGLWAMKGGKALEGGTEGGRKVS